MTNVYVGGVGHTKFVRVSKREKVDYPSFVTEACKLALQDANISYDDVQAVWNSLFTCVVFTCLDLLIQWISNNIFGI